MSIVNNFFEFVEKLNGASASLPRPKKLAVLAGFIRRNPFVKADVFGLMQNCLQLLDQPPSPKTYLDVSVFLLFKFSDPTFGLYFSLFRLSVLSSTRLQHYTKRSSFVFFLVQ